MHKISDVLLQADKSIEILKALLEKYPDIKTNCGSVTTHLAKIPKFNYYKFSSKQVNSNFSDYRFRNGWATLSLEFFSQININGITFKVYSDPSSIKIARIIHANYYYKSNIESKSRIILSDFKASIKRNKFVITDNVLNEYIVFICDYLKNNPGYKLEPKNVSPRLKKLLPLI